MNKKNKKTNPAKRTTLRKGSNLENIVIGKIINLEPGMRDEVVVDIKENLLTSAVYFNQEIYIVKRKLDSYVLSSVIPIKAERISFNDEKFGMYKEMLIETH